MHCIGPIFPHPVQSTGTYFPHLSTGVVLQASLGVPSSTPWRFVNPPVAARPTYLGELPVSRGGEYGTLHR